MTAAGIAGMHHSLSELLILILVFGTASVLGDSVNYWFGAFIVKQLDRIPFLRKHLNGEFASKVADNLHPRRWLLFLVLGRFIPFVRTIVPLVAHRLGLAFHSYVKMALFASFLWSTVMVSIGYYAGHLELPTEWLIGLIVVGAIVVIFTLRHPAFRQYILDLLTK
ncbi:DedA/Tvp38 family (DedA) [Eupransor demetentiae]|uniref:DedA/Tvp38 family (DedA) n=2 Tax=Eupransor demetentiae TaxID=3109584 RepID=A0ABP0ES86_9LACO|nr:DedA/Tvp38 family (DedA) [Lactobacillaceae bacterium LMG 33000]